MFNSLHGGDCGRARWKNTTVAILAGCLLGAMPAQGAGDQWTMSAVEGVATVVVGGGGGYAATQGTPIAVGATLVTGPDGIVTLTRGGDSIDVHPNSEMTVPDMSDTDHLGVVQSFGKLLYRMETRDSWNFEVRTPYLAATVKGTVFVVAVSYDQATVSVSEGMVRVVPVRGGRGEMVRAGSRASVSATSAHEVRLKTADPETESSSDTGPVHGKPADAGANNGRQRGGGAAGNAQSGGAQGGNPPGAASLGRVSRGGAAHGSGFQGGQH